MKCQWGDVAVELKLENPGARCYNDCALNARFCEKHVRTLDELDPKVGFAMKQIEEGEDVGERERARPVVYLVAAGAVLLIIVGLIWAFVV